jgi:NAD(P)-dependent dehydrogenase (short-subunit alcohol dehydrogenase family)
MNNQRVIVTAGAAGIGREIARAFAANGAKVFVCDIDVKMLEALDESRESMWKPATPLFRPSVITGRFSGESSGNLLEFFFCCSAQVGRFVGDDLVGMPKR